MDPFGLETNEESDAVGVEGAQAGRLAVVRGEGSDLLGERAFLP